MDRTPLSLIRACKDEPFDYTRRLVLADWLEEHGDAERAQLIRLQVLPGGEWAVYPGSATRRVRIARLLHDNAERWLGPACQWYSRALLERGFLTIKATARQLLDHPPDTLPPSVVPWLDELGLRPEPDGYGDVLASSLVGLFSRLEVRGDYSDQSRKMGAERLGVLLANPALQARTLNLGHNRLDAGCARLLARCERLAGLRSLTLDSTPLDDDAGRALAQAPWLAGVTRLDLGSTWLGAAGFQAIFSSPHLGTLTHLGLSSSDLDEAACRVIARSARLSEVEELDLEYARLEDDAFHHLADSPHLRPYRLPIDGIPLGAAGTGLLLRGRLVGRIRQLELNDCELDGSSCARLLSSPRLASLESLSLWEQVGEAGCRAMAEAGHFGNLRSASFGDASIGPAGAALLGRARGLDNLAHLWISMSPLGPAGLKALAEGPGLPALQSLQLHETFPQARGVQALVGSGLAARLQHLELDGNRLTPRAAAALAKLESSGLLELDLGANAIGPEGAEALAGCVGLSSLAVLKLYDNRIRDRGLTALLASPHLKSLHSLDVRENRLTRAGAEALRGWARREAMTYIGVGDKGISVELAADTRVG